MNELASAAFTLLHSLGTDPRHGLCPAADDNADSKAVEGSPGESLPPSCHCFKHSFLQKP